MTLEEIKTQIEQKQMNKDEQIRFLRKHRYCLLEAIHVMQQELDQIDYMIYETKHDRRTDL